MMIKGKKNFNEQIASGIEMYSIKQTSKMFIISCKRLMQLQDCIWADTRCRKAEIDEAQCCENTCSVNFSRVNIKIKQEVCNAMFCRQHYRGIVSSASVNPI